MSDETAPPFMPSPIVDAGRLIAEARAARADAIAEAYRITFGSELGRLVLLHHLQQCGVGGQLGDKGLKYRAGMIDGALFLASAAGYDQTSLAATVLTDQLEENPDGPAFNYRETSEEDALDTFD